MTVLELLEDDCESPALRPSVRPSLRSEAASVRPSLFRRRRLSLLSSLVFTAPCSITRRLQTGARWPFDGWLTCPGRHCTGHGETIAPHWSTHDDTNKKKALKETQDFQVFRFKNGQVVQKKGKVRKQEPAKKTSSRTIDGVVGWWDHISCKNRPATCVELKRTNSCVVVPLWFCARN